MRGDGAVFVGEGQKTLLYSKPLEKRKRASSSIEWICNAVFSPSGKGTIVTRSFEDTFRLGYIASSLV